MKTLAALRALAAATLLALPGCALIEGQAAADSEEILAQAGFQRQPLDEPGLPARHLVEAGGSYQFADPDFCRCVYVGGATEYAELQRLRAERKSERAWVLGRSASATSLDSRTLWGPWDPEGLDLIKAPVARR
jgi:hypothetical protein